MSDAEAKGWLESKYPWVEAQVAAFHERVEMMVLGFIDEHRKCPVLVLADDQLRTTGWMAAYVTTQRTEEGVDPRLAQLAMHGARAWRQWTSIEPDRAIVTFRILADRSASVTIARRTPELERAVERAVLEGGPPR